MDSISDRISQCIVATGLTKTAFSQKIGLTQAYVSALSIGRKIPSDRTISDICREFNVNETWLRTGEGEMFLQADSDNELKRIFEAISISEDETLKKFVRAYWRLSDSAKAGFRQMLDNLVKEYETGGEANRAIAAAPVNMRTMADTTGQARTEPNIAVELAEMKRQNQEIIQQNQEMARQNKELLTRLEVLEKEEDEWERKQMEQSISPTRFHT